MLACDSRCRDSIRLERESQRNRVGALQQMHSERSSALVLCNRSQQMVEFQAYCCRKTYSTADTSYGHEEALVQMVEFLLFRRMKAYSA